MPSPVRDITCLVAVGYSCLLLLWGKVTTPITKEWVKTFHTIGHVVGSMTLVQATKEQRCFVTNR
jgi:hypothetical protein